MSVHIGFLEDDPFQARVLATLFEQVGYKASHAADIESMLVLLKKETFDLLLLDWVLPDGTADSIISYVRRELGMDLPVLVLSAQEDEDIIVQALKIGADDYVVKPLRKKEMLARIESQLRRHNKDTFSSPITPANPITIENQQCLYNGIALKLSDKEHDLLKYLLENTGALISRAKILEAVWGITAELNTRTVDTHISRLRKKLQDQCEGNIQIVGIHGHGYRLELAAD